MASERRTNELETLKAIAGTINQSRDAAHMLNSVLEKLLEATGLQSGWIFLADAEDKAAYTCAAVCNVPPALSRENHLPLREGSCWCLDRYGDDKLNRAVNILNCKRLEDANFYGWGDTRGISHHATIPLWSGNRRIGILNVAAPGKLHFSEHELALLQSVALQIGTAMERIKLYEQEQIRANRFTALGEITKNLGVMLESGQIPGHAARYAALLLNSPFTAFLMSEESRLAVRAVHDNEALTCPIGALPLPMSESCRKALETRQPVIAEHSMDDEAFSFIQCSDKQLKSVLVVPLFLRSEPIGILLAGRKETDSFEQLDAELAIAYADHISLALENARLFEERQDLARWEERHRLARDLHDSVSQMLFSLNMTAKALKGMVSGLPQMADSALEDIQKLSQSAIGEMRSLIYQLRPAGLEEGLLTGLRKYGAGLGLHVNVHKRDVDELPRKVEEALFRIGQEALNNIRKHAGTEHAEISLASTRKEIFMNIGDDGRGMPGSGNMVQGGSLTSGYGLNTMRERVEQLRGALEIDSVSGQGTKLKIRIPLQHFTGDGGKHED